MRQALLKKPWELHYEATENQHLRKILFKLHKIKEKRKLNLNDLRLNWVNFAY